MAKPNRPTITLEVLKPMRYNTRRLLPGDTFEAEVKHGKAFILLKKARAHRSPESLAQIPQKLVERASTSPIMLYGSSILSATYEIGGRTVQLGEIVKNAHSKTELTPDQWNLLPSDTREALLADELKLLQTEAGGNELGSTTEINPVDEKKSDEAGEGDKSAGEGNGETSEDDKSEEEKAPELTPAEALEAARAEYKQVVGRAAYGGWDVDKVNEKLAEFKAAQK